MTGRRLFDRAPVARSIANEGKYAFMQKLAIVLAVLTTWMPISAVAVDSSAEITHFSTYSAIDRQQILADGAKKEGALTIPIPDLNAVLRLLVAGLASQ